MDAPGAAAAAVRTVTSILCHGGTGDALSATATTVPGWSLRGPRVQECRPEGESREVSDDQIYPAR